MDLSQSGRAEQRKAADDEILLLSPYEGTDPKSPNCLETPKAREKRAVASQESYQISGDMTRPTRHGMLTS
ncbi:hypothetical protein ACHAP5_004203 [Fusarium lateritium]